MEKFKFVIAGGGMVAGYAAKQFVESGLASGDLAILSSDDSVPYERPPLSKGFLAGKDSEESIRVSPEDFYKSHGIELKLEVEIAAVDADRKRLSLKTGEIYEFDNLVIATGARPRTLNVPGADLLGVYYLRSLDDSKSIRRYAENVKRAVVLGGGFIGMETAAVLSQKGIEVTMVLREDRIWKRFFSPQMSTFFENYYQKRGVRFIKTTDLTAISGEGAVSSVALKDGQKIPCELVMAGIGVQPVTELLAGSGITVDNGVVVNEYLVSNYPGIYAAGDVANYVDVLFRERRRVEHWDNAVSQGQYCAKALMGDRSPFRHVPYFFSDVFDLSYEYWGDSEGADQIVHRGDMSGNSFSVWWLKGGVLVAAFAMNRPDDKRESAPKWIEAGQRLSAAQLEDASKPIDAAIDSH